MGHRQVQCGDPEVSKEKKKSRGTRRKSTTQRVCRNFHEKPDDTMRVFGDQRTSISAVNRLSVEHETHWYPERNTRTCVFGHCERLDLPSGRGTLQLAWLITSVVLFLLVASGVPVSKQPSARSTTNVQNKPSKTFGTTSQTLVPSGITDNPLAKRCVKMNVF